MADNSMTIINVSDPKNPVFESSIKGMGTPNYLGGISKLFVVSHFCFAACSKDNSFVVIDCNDTKNPEVVAVISGSGAPNYLGGARDVSVSYTHLDVYKRQD